MVTAKEIEQFSELVKIFKKLRNNCDLHGKSFQECIINDVELGIIVNVH